jgi:hypothetical protein
MGELGCTGFSFLGEVAGEVGEGTGEATFNGDIFTGDPILFDASFKGDTGFPGNVGTGDRASLAGEVGRRGDRASLAGDTGFPGDVGTGDVTPFRGEMGRAEDSTRVSASSVAFFRSSSGCMATTGKAPFKGLVTPSCNS